MSAFVVRNSPIHGTGVFAVRDIEAEEEIVEYAGRRLTYAEADTLYPDDNGHTFLYELNEQYMIDAAVDGNDARWINHSCDPNCEAVLEEDDGDDRRKDKVFIEAIRDIQPGEELSYNYGIRLEEKHTKELKKIWECRCGSPNCTGTMLQPKKDKSKKKKKKDKKKKKGKGKKD